MIEVSNGPENRQRNVFCFLVRPLSSLQLYRDTVDAEIEALPADMRARLSRISVLVEEFGLEHLREPHIKHLRGPLWEMRMRGKDGISRAIYVTASGKRAVLLRVFTKKTQDTPNREIELAMKRAEEIDG